MPWRPNVPSPTWRAFLQNHMHDIAAVDMFVVATAAFRFLYAIVVLGHDRRKIIHFDITAHPTQAWLSRQMTEAFPWDTAPRYLLRDRDASYGQGFRDRVQTMINKGMTLEQVKAAKPTMDYDPEYGREPGVTARFVEAVYRSLKEK